MSGKKKHIDIAKLRRSAWAGDVAAQYRLAYLQITGKKGVKLNFRQAHILLRRVYRNGENRMRGKAMDALALIEAAVILKKEGAADFKSDMAACDQTLRSFRRSELMRGRISNRSLGH